MAEEKNLGMGVLIHRLFGDNTETVESINSAIGQSIVSAAVDGSSLKICLSDGTTLAMFDDGQSCCEERYMHTDDTLSEYVGAKIVGFELQEVPNEDHEWGEHEIQFLAVSTDRGIFKVSTHNIHNGYYGGFYIVAKIEKHS